MFIVRESKKQLYLADKLILYTFRVSSKARRLRLSVYADGQLMITAPVRMSQKYINWFIHEKTQWILNTISKQKIQAQDLVPNDPLRYLKLKEPTRQFVKQRLRYFNDFYGFSYHRIAIKNQSTRWGSCSSAGNLNFNYRLFLLEPALADYIIVHELCHINQMNHSTVFWTLVEKTIPNYRQCRTQLRKMGLHFI